MTEAIGPGRLCSWNSPGKNTGVGSHTLLQGIFPIQGSNPGLLHYRRILYHLCHQRSPRILEWVSLSLLQGIFPTQGSSPHLSHLLHWQVGSLPQAPPGKPSDSSAPRELLRFVWWGWNNPFVTFPTIIAKFMSLMHGHGSFCSIKLVVSKWPDKAFLKCLASSKINKGSVSLNLSIDPARGSCCSWEG